MNLSKSKYTKGITCPKKLWLSCYKPEKSIDSNNQSTFTNGTKIGELARSLFGNYILIDYDKGLESMLKETKKYLEDKPNIICEASFSYDNNFCSVDILKKDLDGVEIYEVKSSTEIEEIYMDDISYQVWVLRKCGLNVKKASIVFVNNKYVKNGELDIHKFFNIEDVTDKLYENVEAKVKELQEVINNNKEPNIDLSISCHKPQDCPFFKYCTRKLPSPNVFDLGWHLNFNKKLEMYERGNVTYEDILDKEIVNDKVTEQIRQSISNIEPKINKDNIKEFLSCFYYPLYFLDFESYQAVIPTIDGTHPYQQICFQYSLHIVDKNNKIIHKEFLSDDYDGNPMYGLCKSLCEDIPKDSCVIAYHKSFECSRLEEMAEQFPEFSEHLLNISKNIIDIEKPFANHDYYVKDMAGRSSIKVVLPALFPKDPELDYHNLNDVHKGDEASAAYLSLKDLSKEEEEKLRHSLLKYCELDTLAMVKIWEKLKEV